MENRDGTKWTEAEDFFLTTHWRDRSDKKLGEALGRTESGVKHRRGTLDLVREYNSPAQGIPVSLLSWSEGMTMQSAEQFVERMDGVPNYERIPLLHKRIEEGMACLLSLHANEPGDGKWGNAEKAAASKLRRMIRELKTKRDRMYSEASPVHEAA